MARGTLSFIMALLALAPAAAEAERATVEIKVLSNRADLISGGDALVQVRPAGATVTVGGRDVTTEFAVRPNGRYQALLTGLAAGPNRVVARQGGSAARLTIRNHPQSGPVTAGPQIQPWTCLPGALDEQCTREPAFSYSYKPAGGGPLRPYDPDSPPGDVATTRVGDKDVPFIVREEVGTLDRDEYRIAALFDPAQPSAPWAPQDGINHRLVIFHGVSCDTEYAAEPAPDVLNETALAKGFVTMSHALNNAGHNCNIATQAESMIMTKERVVEQFGPVRWTIGSGCSGGSLVQQQVANAYPGLYQGITPACSFTDAWSSAMQYVNYQLLRRYFENPAAWAPGVAWTPVEMGAVEGHPNGPVNALTFTTAIASSGDPSRDCPGVPPEMVYDPQTNPNGVRCSLHDYMRNVFGPRADGITGRPVGNVGLQYGLKSLLTGRITPAQFLDVNEKIGSWDDDYEHTPARMDADRPALDRVYRSGAVNQADNLDEVAIIDLRGPDPGAFHDVYRTSTMRARLLRNFGTAANQILWRGQVPLLGDAGYTDASILAVDRWLAAVAADKRRVPRARKIIEDKPADIVDRCTNGAGVELDKSVCDTTVTAYTDPQLEAGMPETDDTLRCELKPLRRDDYGSVTFTDAQWAKLNEIYPQGVCDFTKPGLGRHPTTPWQTYQDRRGGVIYGGRGLGRPPKSTPIRVRARN